MNTEKRLIDMTLSELLAILDERDNRRKERDASGLPTLVYGLKGICEIYHCSPNTAARILRSGRIDAAVTRASARKLIVNVDKALALLPNQ